MADVFKANFKQLFDFFRCFGNFYDEVVVGFFVERLFDLNVKKGCVKPFVAEKLLDVERVFRLMIERCGLPMLSPGQFKMGFTSDHVRDSA